MRFVPRRSRSSARSIARAAGGAVLVGVTATALALSETIVADVADRNSGHVYRGAVVFAGSRALRAARAQGGARAARIEMAAASAGPAPEPASPLC